MESIMSQITKDEVWNEYLEFKKSQMSMCKNELEEIEDYINSRKYKKIVKELQSSNIEFSIPEKHFINKINSNKKRVIYQFPEDENMVLKVITYLILKKYDGKFANNCYSFRRKYTAKDAINRLARSKSEC